MADQVNLQLVPGASPDEAKLRLARLPGVERVRQVFPEERDDEELRRMFVLDVSHETSETLMRELRASELVAEAELVQRRGIAPPASPRKR